MTFHTKHLPFPGIIRSWSEIKETRNGYSIEREDEEKNETQTHCVYLSIEG